MGNAYVCWLYFIYCFNSQPQWTINVHAYVLMFDFTLPTRIKLIYGIYIVA